MISKYTYKNLKWIDLESPTDEEIISLVREYNLPPLVGDELARPSFRSKVDKYNDVIYLILHFPMLKGGKGGGMQEVDFLIGKDFLITTHYSTIDPIHEFTKIFETNAILNKSRGIGAHAGFIFYYLAKELYRYSADRLEEIDEELDTIEKNIFDGKESEMVEFISQTNKNLLDWKRSLRFHGEVLASLERAGDEFFGEKFSYYLSSISSEYRKVQSIIDGHRDTLNDLRITNDSLLTDKTNETMRTLTIMSFVIFPLTLIASVFSMNTIKTPLVGIKNDFWIILSIMAIAVLTMYIYFKRKKWL